MLVRLIAVVELVLGVSIASAKGLPYLKMHIGMGFAMALLVAVLAMIAAVRRAFVMAAIGIVFAVLLPVIGLQQFPLKFGPALGAVQYAHVLIALGAIGVAEALHGAIRKRA